MSVESYEVSPRPPALAHSMAQWSGARPNWRAAGGSNRGSGIRFFRTASPHTPYISVFLARPPRPQAPNLSIFWTGLPAGTPKIYPHRWTAFVRIFRGPSGTSDAAPNDSVCHGINGVCEGESLMTSVRASQGGRAPPIAPQDREEHAVKGMNAWFFVLGR